MTEALSRNLRDAIRSLAARPGVLAMSLAALALGIGANTAIFSVVDAVLLRPLPYAEANRLVMVWDTNPAASRFHERPSPGNFREWRETNGVFAGMTVFHPGSAILRGEQQAEVVRSAKVTPDFFEVLGAEAALGRTFGPEDGAGAVYNAAEQYQKGDRVLVMSDRLWRRHFGANPGIVGASVSLDGASWTVAGVMPPEFALPSEETEVWLPWDIAGSFAQFASGPPRDWRFLNVVARLGPGVGRAQAEGRMASLAEGMAERHPKENEGWGVRLVPLEEELLGRTRPVLLLLLGATAFVFLIACANVAGFQIARVAARSREVAVRLALGATPRQIGAQVLTESLILALAGAALGLLFAAAALKLLLALQPWDLPRVGSVSLDARVLAFTLLVSLLCAALSGLAPALHAARGGVSATLKEGGQGAMGGRARIRRALVGAEVAVCLVLLVGAGLFARSFVRARAMDPGFDPDHLLVMRIALDNAAYKTGAQSSAFYRDLMGRLAALPGVRSAGASTALPMSAVGIDFDRPYWREGEADPGGQAPKADIRMVTPDYFRTMGMTLRAGRPFDDGDTMETPTVVVVNESLALRTWSETDVVGRRLILDYKGMAYPYEIVGIVNDTRHRGLKSTPRPEIFIPHAQNPYLAMNVAVRTAGDPARLARAVERTVAAVDPSQPVHSVVIMRDLVSKSIAPDRFCMVLLGALAAVAVILAATGIFGLLAYLVGRRTKEFGLRRALGAGRGHVVRLVIGESLRLAAVGGLAGLFLAAALARSAADLLFGVTPADPLTLVSVTAALVAIALASAGVPAWRAVQVDPAEALRCE